MRFVAVLLVAFACSGAFASEPGQPLDCSDWVIVKPGIGCSESVPRDCQHSPICRRGANMAVGADGCRMYVSKKLVFSCPGYGATGRTALMEVCHGTESVVAYVDDRCGAVVDLASGQYPEPNNSSPDTDDPDYKFHLGNNLTMDPTSGNLFVALGNDCRVRDAGCSYGYVLWLAQFSGFATTFDVFQTFAPQPSSLGFRVPYMPEGMGGADHFDTYWGPLAHPIDFTQAHPLQCSYPAKAPHVGDYLTVADPLPDPEPGTGRYYVTAATYQGATRYGRKTAAGHLSGRDPAVLPGCVQP